MNIGVDATALYGRYNGVEYALWNLLCGLNAIESETARDDGQNPNRYTVYVPRDGPSREQLKVFDARWRWVRLPFLGREKARRVWWQQMQLPRQLQRDGCDLLHAPTYVSPLRARVPIVLTVYDLIALSHPQFATPLNRLHYGALMKLSIRAARRVIVPSEPVRKEIARRVPRAASKTRVVPLGVEPLFFAEHDEKTRDEVRARYGLPPRFLLFVGNFEPKKNLPRLLKALDLIPDAPPLILAGGARAWNNGAPNRLDLHAPHSQPDTAQTIVTGARGIESDAAETDAAQTDAAQSQGRATEAASKNGVTRGATVRDATVRGATARGATVCDATVRDATAGGAAAGARSIGYVRRRDLPVLYSLCEAFVFPSLAEGFGLPVLEALAAGVPVVTSTHVPLPNLADAARLCDAHDPHSIARAIRAVLEPDCRDELRRGPQFARPYTWRRAAETTLDVYREAVAYGGAVAYREAAARPK